MKSLWSFLIVAVLLPVVIFGVGMKDNLLLTASADANPILRIWFEPANVVLSPGQTIEVKVMAESDAARRLASNLVLKLNVSGSVLVTPLSVSHDEAFLGRAQVGTIEVSGSGEVDIDVASSSVNPADFVLQSSKLVVGPN